jgi:hypothetical protein
MFTTLVILVKQQINSNTEMFPDQSGVREEYALGHVKHKNTSLNASLAIAAKVSL